MNGELSEMKKSHRAVEDAMETMVEQMAGVEREETLTASARQAMIEQTRSVSRHLIEHVENEEAAARMTERLFSGRPLHLEQLGESARKMHRVLEQFTETLEELDDDSDIHQAPWKQARAKFDELVETLRECTETEWKFYARYSTLLEPGGLGA